MTDILSIKIDTNIEKITAAVERMAAHFDAAPDDDPAKRAMIEFGEIVTERHIEMQTEFERGRIVVTVALCPDLQRIADMVPD